MVAVFDDDGNGSISVDELRQVMFSLVDRITDDEVRGMVEQADSEGHGEISFDGEFQNLKLIKHEMRPFADHTST